MTQHVGKGGIPAFAYSASDTTSLLSVSLILKCNELHAQATLCLQCSLLLHGFEDAQVLTLQYDANNLVPGTISLKPATNDLPQAQLERIVRNGNPQVRRLSLTLKKHCPIWCALSGSIAPQHDHDGEFTHLAALAQATEVHILFDYNWLAHEKKNTFQRLVNHPDQLSGFPVSRYYLKHYKLADASIFNFPEAIPAGAESEGTTEDDEQPPSYVAASSKRPRNASTSPTSSTHPRKRILLPPYEYIPISPTEKATSPETSPQLRQSTKPNANSVLSSSTAPVLDFQRALDKAVERLLPSMIEAALPSILPSLLATSSPTQSSCDESQASHAAPPPVLTELGISLSDHVARKIEAELASVYAHTLRHAKYMRSTADVEFFEGVEDGRLELGIAKDDGLAEVDRVTDEKIRVFRQECELVSDDVLERVAQKGYAVCDGVKESLDDLARQKEDLSREKGWLRWETQVLKKERSKFEDEKQKVLGESGRKARGTRARSAPA